LFTVAGNGTFNAVRYFYDVSHGLVDLSGSQVFGWLTVDANHNDYTQPEPPPPGWMQTIGRAELTTRARQAALDAGVPLGNFWGDVIIFNVAIGGPFGSAGVPHSPAANNRPYACSDHRSTSTAVFSHEMGHGYGLAHSRLEGSSEDYRDPWDIMSALATHIAGDPDFGTRGPALNAANMRALGWWNPTRVWRPSSAIFDSAVTLRPLHRRDLPGSLAAELSMGAGGLIVEYRKRDRWDAAIPRSAVFVHRYAQYHSYLIPSTSGRPDLVAGDRVLNYNGPLPYVPNVEVEVMSIDDANDTATIKVSGTPGVPIPHGYPDRVFGGIPYDGGGGVFVNGRFVPVPPWNPMADVLGMIADLPTGEDATQTYLRHALTRQMLTGIAARIQSMIAEIDAFGEPDPEARLKDLPAPKSQTTRRRAAPPKKRRSR
jgi:M6 family metalloprotease-like protein